LGKSGVYVSRQPPYELGWQLRLLFQNLHINCVIDVGAHYGEYGSFVRRVLGFPGRLVSFEPQRDSYRTLAIAAAGDDQWLTFPYALGEEVTQRDMHVFESGVFNSFLPPTGFVEQRFGSGGHETGVQTVQIRTLDDFIAEAVRGIDEPRVYLKMDTQGYDQHVLAGGEHMLQHIVALQSEVAVTHLYEDAPDFEVAVHHFRELGFTPIGFFPVVKESDDLGVIEFDCVAIRRM
jgi:FkbM family methyltransferase